MGLELDQSNDSSSLGAQEISELGIVKIPVDYFHYKEFRYTHFGGRDRRSKAR